MAEHLLGKITLAKDYDPSSTINDANVSDLQNAAIVNATTNILLSNQLNITATATPFYPTLPMGYTVDFSYGTLFTVAVDIDVTTAGESRRSVQIQLLNSSDTVIAQGAITLLSSGANAISEEIDSGGTEWTKIRLKCFYKGGTGPTFEYTDLAVTNSAQSVFDSGDVIIVYWDDSAEDFIVQRQDNPVGTITTITSGPNLGPLQFEQFFDGGFYKYCDGTTLVLFTFTFDSPGYPYFGKQLLYGNNLCLAGNVACDVRFVSTTITGATNKYSSDGQVQLTAYYTGYPSANNSVKYTEFDPDTDIRGQYANAKNSTGLFTGLKAGTYTFYAVDTYGCFNSIQAVVPAESNSTYSPKYRLQYYDVHSETQSVIDIQERGYGGDPIDVTGGSAPFVLSKEAGELNNKLDTIRATFAELTLISITHFQFMSLYTQDDKKFRISYTHGSTSWKGYLVPSIYREAYSPAVNYPIVVTATDGLASLGDYDFVDSSKNVFSGLMSLRQILLECLNKIGLRLNVVIAVNKYAAGMSSTTADDPLGQAYLDAETFLEDAQPKKCNEVIEMVLKPMGAFIIQKNSKWHIIDMEPQTEAYYYREYDYLGAFVTSGSIDPVLEIESPDATFDKALLANSSHTLELIPAYGKMSVIAKLQGRESIFPLSLDQWTPNIAGGGSSTPIDDPDNSNYKALQISGMGSGYFRLISPEFDVNTIADALELSFRLKADFTTFSSIDVGGLFIGTNVLNTIDPQFIPLAWSLRISVSSVDFYYNKGIGWSREAAWGTSVTSVAIPTTHPLTRTFTTQTGLSIAAGGIIKVQYDASNYFRAVVTSYNSATGAVSCDSFAEVGSGTYTSWTIYNAGSEYSLNRLYLDKYREYVDFNERINLPVQSPVSTPTTTIQLNLYFYGEGQYDYTDVASVRALPAATYPAGYQIRGSGGGAYELRPGTEADNGSTILRPTDYDGTSNAVYWEQLTNPGGGNLINLTLKDVRTKFLPNKRNLLNSHTSSFVNDTNYREVLDYEIEICDIPTELQVGHEAYKNILRYSDGTPTYGWKRRGIDESLLIQELLLKTIGNQYASQSWRLSGDFLVPDMNMATILKQRITQAVWAVTNPDLPGGTGWEQAGAGTSWTNGGTYYQVAFTGAGDSLIIRQAGSIGAGTRIRIDFHLIRLSSSGNRVDRLVMVFYNGSDITQERVLLDNIETDTDSTESVILTVENTTDKIGFYIENMSGSGAATYQIDSFDGEALDQVRYYYLNRVRRIDKFNLYDAELVQIIPTLKDATDDDVIGSGGFAGDAWSSGWSNGWGSGFGQGSFTG